MRWQNHTTVFSQAVIVSSDVSGCNLWEKKEKKKKKKFVLPYSFTRLHVHCFASRCSSNKVASQHASHRMEHPGRLCLNVFFCAAHSETRASSPAMRQGSETISAKVNSMP